MFFALTAPIREFLKDCSRSWEWFSKNMQTAIALISA
jgi:hypothetical protein